MPLRTRLFIIVSLIILVILAISIALVIRRRQAAAPPQVVAPAPAGTVIDQSNFNQGQLNQLPTPIPAPAGKVATSEEVEQNAARQMGKIFLERVASYSSDSNYQNIKDIQALVTPSLWATLSKTIGKSGGAFVGVTTEALNTALTSWSASAATITIKTRQTTNKSGSTTVQYRDATVSLTKTGDSWLVNFYSWVK